MHLKKKLLFFCHHNFIKKVILSYLKMNLNLDLFNIIKIIKITEKGFKRLKTDF